jgi:hypothetical protein
MFDIHAASSAVIAAPPPIVYGLIADYRQGHPSILPPKYFQNLQVEEGGIGAGTRISFQMRSFGRVRWLHARVTEPEPGRQLCEIYPDTGIVTTFTVESEDDGRNSRVTIATHYSKAGLAGWLERWLAPGFLRVVFAAELRELGVQAKARTSSRAPAGSLLEGRDT